MDSFLCPQDMPMPSDMKEFIDEDGTVSLLRRNVLDRIMARLASKRGYSVYLAGAGGYGKSTILFQLACTLRTNPDFCVLYIPELHNVLVQAATNEDAAVQTILRDLMSQASEQEHDLYQIGEQEDASPLALLGELIVRVMEDGNIVLIVDQWNAAFLRHGISSEVARIFQGILNSTRGNIICAVSASFVCEQLRLAMPDASRQTKREHVTKLSEVEAKHLICHYQRIQKRGHPGDTEIDCITKQTSGIPRLIRFVKDCDLRNRSEWSPKLDSLAIQYYDDCIKKRIESGGEPEFAKTLIMSCLGEDTKQQDEIGWGLFERQTNGSMIAVSPYVVRALRNRLHRSDDLIWLAKILPADCAGYLLELYIIHCFEEMCRRGDVLLLGSMNFGGIKRVRRLSPSDVLRTGFSLTDGDAVVICGNFPVVDFVVFGNGNIAFIQVSMTPYSGHSTGYKDLFQYGKKGGPAQNKSVFEYFCTSAGKAYHCSRKKPVFPKGDFDDVVYAYVHGGRPYTPNPDPKDKAVFIMKNKICNFFKGSLGIHDILPNDE